MRINHFSLLLSQWVWSKCFIPSQPLWLYQDKQWVWKIGKVTKSNERTEGSFKMKNSILFWPFSWPFYKSALIGLQYVPHAFHTQFDHWNIQRHATCCNFNHMTKWHHQKHWVAHTLHCIFSDYYVSFLFQAMFDIHNREQLTSFLLVQCKEIYDGFPQGTLNFTEPVIIEAILPVW